MRGIWQGVAVWSVAAWHLPVVSCLLSLLSLFLYVIEGHQPVLRPVACEGDIIASSYRFHRSIVCVTDWQHKKGPYPSRWPGELQLMLVLSCRFCCSSQSVTPPDMLESRVQPDTNAILKNENTVLNFLYYSFNWIYSKKHNNMSIVNLLNSGQDPDWSWGLCSTKCSDVWCKLVVLCVLLECWCWLVSYSGDPLCYSLTT